MFFNEAVPGPARQLTVYGCNILKVTFLFSPPVVMTGRAQHTVLDFPTQVIVLSLWALTSTPESCPD